MTRHLPSAFFFFFNDTATTEIYTLSLHDALPIYLHKIEQGLRVPTEEQASRLAKFFKLDEKETQARRIAERSEEHTSELQSPCNLVCRLLLEKKNRVVPRLPPTGPTDAQAQWPAR